MPPYGYDRLSIFEFIMIYLDSYFVCFVFDLGCHNLRYLGKRIQGDGVLLPRLPTLWAIFVKSGARCQGTDSKVWQHVEGPTSIHFWCSYCSWLFCVMLCYFMLYWLYSCVLLGWLSIGRQWHLHHTCLPSSPSRKSFAGVFAKWPGRVLTANGFLWAGKAQLWGWICAQWNGWWNMMEHVQPLKLCVFCYNGHS